MAIDASIIRRIRLLIPDTEPIFGDAEDEYIFSDEEIEDFYVEGFENTKCAAGLAMIAIGSSLAFQMRVIKNYETSTDGAKLFKEYVTAGNAMYDRGLQEIEDEVEGGGMFEIAYPEFGYQRHPEGMSHGSYRTGGWFG